jgi:hypothetical protein
VHSRTCALARYLPALNRLNKLGTGGDLAEEFGELMSAMWLQGWKHLTPSFFKDTLAGARHFASSILTSSEFVMLLFDAE